MAEPSQVNPRHESRRRHIARTAITGIVSKAAFFLSAFLVSWIAIPELGPERFGVLMTVFSLMAFLAIADLGVGSSLVTSLSRALGASDYRRVRRLQINGLAVVCAVAIAIAIIGASLLYLDIGDFVFPASGPEIRREATNAFAVFGILFAMSLPLTLIGKIQLGLQLGHVTNSWLTAGAALNLAGGAFAASHYDSVPLVILGMMIGTLSCGIANTVQYFFRSEHHTRPVLADIDTKVLSELLRESFFYLLLQLIFVITYASDTLLVARILGAEQASIFALSERIFSVVAVAVAAVSGALWAAYGDAMGAADEAWASETLRTSTMRIGVSSVMISFAIFYLLQPIVHYVSTGRLEVPPSLAIAMACWRVVEAIGASLSVYLFARQEVKLSLIMGGATALTSIVTKLLLTPYFGIVLVPIATTTTYIIFCLLPSLYFIHKIDSRRSISI